MTEATKNPLSEYFRDISIYIKLPSCGYYSNPEDIEPTPNGEVAVYPMTTEDEMLFKSPDALLNGEAVAQVIKNCCPNIKNVYNLPTNDIEVLLLAIRHANYEDQLDFEAKCPECETQKEFGISIESSLTNIDTLPEKKEVELDNGLVVRVKPYTYASTIKAALLAFNEGKFLQLVSQEDLSDEEKANKASGSFRRATKLKVELLGDSILGVYKNGKSITENREHINEWVKNISSKHSHKLEKSINELNRIGVLKEVELDCDSCSHKWKTEIQFDPSDFFGQSF